MSDRHDELHDGSRSRPNDQARPGPADPQTPHDALGAYAMGALDVDDQRLFELHLFVCAACRSELASYQRTANLLPFGLPPERPPAGARERLLAAARGEASESLTVAMPIVRDDEAPTEVGAPPAASEAPTAVHPVSAPDEAPTIVEAAAVPVEGEGGPPTVPVRRVPPRRGLRIKLASIGWAAALLLVVASGLFVYAWSATGPHASPDVEMLARLPGGQLLTLTGTGAPTASARLYVVEGGRRAELTVDGLPPLLPGRVYQLWFAEPGQPVRTGGAFRVDPRGDASVQVTIPTPMERVRAVAVTQEPAPGSGAPTGVHLLDWTP